LRTLFVALLLLMGSGCAPPAAAHKEHEKNKVEQASTAQGQGRTVAHPMSPEVHEAVKDDLERLEAGHRRPWHVRLIDWVGRVHPFAVHFPLALFPISWIALLLGRRRGAAEPLLRALIIVAGASAAVASVLGWLNAGFSLVDADPLLLWHRWLGTGLGIAGAAIGFWSWRHLSAARSGTMAWVLGLITALLLAQGWLGAALIHGADHMNW